MTKFLVIEPSMNLHMWQRPKLSHKFIEGSFLFADKLKYF